MEILRKNEGVNLYYEVRGQEENYLTEMLQNNRLHFILPAILQRTDRDCSLLYQADGLQSFANRFSREQPDWQRIEELLQSLADCIRELKDYMLPPEGLVLSIAYIFRNPREGMRRGRYLFLYTTNPEQSFPEGMKNLFEEIMPLFDHGNREDTTFFYDLYSRFLDEQFTPEMLLHLVEEGIPASEESCYASGQENVEWGSGDVPRVCGYEDPAHEQGLTTVLSQPDLPCPPGISGFGSAGRTGSHDTEKNGWRDAAWKGNVPDGQKTAGSGKTPKNEKEERCTVPLWLWIAGGGVLLAGGIAFLLMGSSALKMVALMGVVYIILIIIQLHTAEDEKREGKKGVKKGMKSDTGSDAEYMLSGEKGTKYGEKNLWPGKEDAWTGETRRVTHLIPVDGTGLSPISVEGEVCRIGRSQEGNEYCIPSPEISRNHARLLLENGTVLLQDLHSTNGTYVNHERIDRDTGAELHYGDVVSFADEEFYCT